jgi:hypothetical protein
VTIDSAVPAHRPAGSPLTRAVGALRSLHRARAGTLADLVLYLGSAAFAGATALTSTLPAHRAWGQLAVFGYLALVAVAVVQLVLRRGVLLRAGVRMALVFAGWTATTLVPLLVEAAQRASGQHGRAQEEVGVVETAGARLMDTGSPYLSHDGILHALPSLGYLAYVPYNPGIAVFGLPRRFYGDAWWTDARVWFALVTAAALVWALALLRGRVATTRLVRAAQVVTVLPTCALALATGGDDLPVLALTLLALAFAYRRQWLLAGLIAGDAGALKLFALPVLVMLAVLVLTAARTGAARTGTDTDPPVPAGEPVGRWRRWWEAWLGDAVRYLVPAVGVPLLVLLPVVARDPGGVWENLVRYPLGQGLAKSPAASNFPGHLIAVLVPGGKTIAAGLLAVAALAVAVHLLVRPPAGAGAVAARAAVAMLAIIALAPASRFGYLLYPVAYAVWAAVLRAIDPVAPAPDEPADPPTDQTPVATSPTVWAPPGTA